MYNKLKKMKSISSLPIEESEFTQWCHNINMLNALELDEYVLGGRFQLSKMQLDSGLHPLVIPFMVTFNGDDTETNLLSDKYQKYDAETAVSEYGYSKSDTKLMNPEDFKMVSDGLLGAFKKTANLSSVDTLKSVAALANYYKREAQGDKSLPIGPGAPAWVPVQFAVSIKKSRYLHEDTDFVFNEWWAELLRSWKGSKAAKSDDK